MPSSSGAPSSILADELIERATDLRRMLRAAKHVEEARLLVDMFLIQSGVPVFSTPLEEIEEPEVQARTLLLATDHIVRPPSFVTHDEHESQPDFGERSVIESLLGETPLALRKVATISSVGSV